MARIKNLNNAIVREPVPAGSLIERKDVAGQDSARASASLDMAGAADKKASRGTDPFPSRRSDARQVSGKTPRPTDRPGE